MKSTSLSFLLMFAVSVMDQISEAYSRHDRAMFNHFHPRLQVIFGDGTVFDRQALINMIISDSLRNPTVTRSEVKIIELGNVAYVSLIEHIDAKAKDNSSIPPYTGRFSNVFVKEKGQWLLLAEHVTDIPPSRSKIQVDKLALADYSGTYTGAGVSYQIVARENELKVEGSPATLYPFAQDQFFLEGTPITAQFLRWNNQVTHMIIRPGNQDNVVLIRTK